MNQRKRQIGVFSPYREFTQLALECAEDVGVLVQVEEIPLSDVLGVVRRWAKEGAVEVIVARGPAANMITRRNLGIPVVTVNMTTADMLEAIWTAFQMAAGAVAVVDYAYRQPKFDFELIRRVIPGYFHLALYHNDVEIEPKLQELAQCGVETVIGTSVPIIEMAAAAGFRTVLVQSRKESLKEAMKQAYGILQMRNSDRKERMKLTTVLSNVRDGILVFDEDDTVRLCNPAAEKLLRLKAPAVLNRRVTDFSADNPVRLLYCGGVEISNELINANDLLLVVNRNRMRVADVEAGTVVSFQAVDRIRKIEEGIRKELANKGLVAKFAFADIVGKAGAIQRAVGEARRYARSEGTVLIKGESGTGKELFAHSIHNESRRREGPFVAINCSTLPENLLESELFGYEEGAFTGAKKGGKPGLFELAHGGTIFLDEVGELSIHLQARLLRVLQEREIMHIGGGRVIPVDVRVIAATNRDLRAAVNEGRFRQDLFYRVNVLVLRIPPLRERLEDVPELFNYFLKKSSVILRTAVPRTSPELLKELKSYGWPGNVRELQNFVERYVVLGDANRESGSVLRSLLADLSDDMRPKERGRQREITVKLGSFDEMENQIVLQAINLFPEDKSQLARIFGVSRTTLWKKIKRAADGTGHYPGDNKMIPQ